MNKEIRIILVNSTAYYWNPLVERFKKIKGFKNVVLIEWAEEALRAIPKDSPSILVSEASVKHSLENKAFAAGAQFLGKEVKEKFPLCKSILFPVTKDEEDAKCFDFFILAIENDALEQLVKKVEELSSQKAA